MKAYNPTPPSSPSSPERKDRRVRKRSPRWRRQFPRELVLAVTLESSRSLQIGVELQSTTTQRIVGTDAMVDCGATNFGYVDKDFVTRYDIPTFPLPRAMPVFNVDGTPNKAGMISEVVDVVRTYQDHLERITLAVTQLGSQSVILGHGWLRLHNPEID